MNFTVLQEYTGAFVAGATQTLLLSACAIALGLILTVVLYLAGNVSFLGIRRLLALLQEALRLCPPLVLLLFIFYGGPSIGIVLSPFVAATGALSLYFALFGADILRAAAATIPGALLDTETTLATSRWRLIFNFVLPDLFRRTFPAMNTQVVSTLKNSSLASVIAMPELTYVASLTATEVVRPFEIYLVLAASYIVTIAPIVMILRGLENTSLVAMEPAGR